MNGKITVTDKRGGIIFSANIWVLLLIYIFSGKWGFEPKNTRIYIDGDEIPMPAAFDDDKKERG